jgi:hypothetical protein
MSQDHSFPNYRPWENTSNNIVYWGGGRGGGAAVIYIHDVNAELNIHRELSSTFQVLPHHHISNF